MKYDKEVIEKIINDGSWLKEDFQFHTDLALRSEDFEKLFKGTPFRTYDFDDTNFDDNIYKLETLGFVLIKSDDSGIYFLDKENKIYVAATKPTRLDKFEATMFKLIDNPYDKDISITFYHHEKNKERIRQLLEFLFDEVFREGEKENNFYMIAQSQDGLYNQRATFKDIPIKDDRYDLYYGKDFPHEKFVEFMEDETDHLLLIHGDPGAGKSNYIKSLIKNSDRTVIYVPPSMLSVISQPEFVSYMLDNRGSILLIEDGEEILSAERNAATQNLLGMTSGFLKDSMDLKIIATFNIDIGKIDSALRRKGRLHFEYKFRKLTREEGQELSDFLELGLNIDDEYTLADIFNQKPTSLVDSFEERRIGFV